MVLINFKYPLTKDVRSVSVIGEWNNWKPQNLKKDSKLWRLELDIKSGTYLYKFRLNNNKDVIDPYNNAKMPDGQFNPASFICVGTYTNDDKFSEPVVFHEEDKRFVEIVDKNILSIKIYLFDKNVKQIFIKGAFNLQMEKIYSGDIYSIFQCRRRVKDVSNIKYYFELNYGKKYKYYIRSGIYKNSPSKKKWFKWDKKKYYDDAPSWLRNTVFYQIFPDRFYRHKLNYTNPDIKIEKWGKKPGYFNFSGGNLKGIMKKLDYLKDVGINAIYLNPVFKSSSNHRYNTDDYFTIEPMLGNEKDLVNLVKQAHKRDIRVILDGVFNHTSTAFKPFLDVLKNQEKSKFKDWFKIKGFPISLNHENNNYECWAGFHHMPALNIENIDVQNYIFKVARYWIREADIDGWRLDVPFEIPHWFWKKFRKEIRKEKRDACIIGEIWEDGTQYFQGDEFDGVMNYRLKRALETFILDEKEGTRKAVSEINRIYSTYPRAALYSSMSLLSSHDVPRIYTVLNKSLWKFKLLYVLLFTLPGAVSIYYGDEIAMPGKGDPDCRRCMKWNNLSKIPKNIKYFFKNLIKIRKNNPVLREGEIKFYYHQGDVLTFSRYNDKEKVCVFVNKGPATATVDLNKNKSFIDLFNNLKYNKSKLKIQPHSFLILKNIS
ncbi:MAG: glycoside hydrolase family 13 protein [Candidatus Hydrogenedentota bacterium]